MPSQTHNGFKRVIDQTTTRLSIDSGPGDGTADAQARVYIGSTALTTAGAATAALLHGIGTTTTPAKTTTADKNFMGYWLRSDATSGDARGIYTRLYIGAAGSGEAGRFYTTVDGANAATGGTVNGAHISLNVTGSGTISGAGNALRATLDVAAGVTSGGTVAAIQAEFVAGAAAVVPATASLIRLVDSATVSIGNAFQVPTVASGGMFAAHTTQTLTHSIRIVSAAGTKYYIMCTDAATNRTGGA